MDERDIKILNRAIKSAHNLHKNIEVLDFQLEKFNKFEQNISSFKLKSMLTMAITGFLAGAILGFVSAQKWTILN
jgi:hypothetical protein